MPSLNWADIGIRIQERRMELKISQLKLAEMTNLSVVYIGFIEQGKRKCSAECIATIAEALQLSLDDLILGEPAYSSPLEKEITQLFKACSKADCQALVPVIHSLTHMMKQIKGA